MNSTAVLMKLVDLGIYSALILSSICNIINIQCSYRLQVVWATQERTSQVAHQVRVVGPVAPPRHAGRGQ